MIIKHVKKLKGGEVLTEPVITVEKEILIEKGTELKPEYLDLLLFLGIDTVCIEDPYEVFEKPHRFLPQKTMEEFISRIQKILENHIYNGKEGLKKIEPLAREVSEQIRLFDPNMVFDITERSGTLYDHTVMTTFLSAVTAKRLKLKDEQIYDLITGCLLHDLGLRYIAVPYINLNMESGSPSELLEYKKHPIFAYTVLEKEGWLSPAVKNIILSHHERKDGSGFPLRQKTKETECGILQACDIFDCFISGVECIRTNVRSALEYLAEASDILFERKIVAMIEKTVARYPVGTKVKLNTGQNGVVIEQTEDSAHPVIAVLNEKDHIAGEQYDLQKNKKVVILELPD